MTLKYQLKQMIYILLLFITIWLHDTKLKQHTSTFITHISVSEYFRDDNILIITHISVSEYFRDDNILIITHISVSE